MSLTLVSAAERPELVSAAETLSAAIWPAWLRTAASLAYWNDLYRPALARFQTFALDDGAIVGIANSIPLPAGDTLPDTGWDWALETGALAARNGGRSDTLSAIAVTVAPGHRGTGLANRLLQTMKPPALAAGIATMIAPVRPTLKSRYPLTDFATYCGWRRPDGLFFDPWLRTHAAAGATVIGPAPASMTVTASVARWQDWTGLIFPASGAYAIPGGLAPLEVDLDRDTATYREPNLWMRHPLG